MAKPVIRTYEHYGIVWHSFEQEPPPKDTPILCKTQREGLKDAQWYIAMGNSLYMGMRWHTYISKVKRWMWATAKDITLYPLV